LTRVFCDANNLVIEMKSVLQDDIWPIPGMGDQPRVLYPPPVAGLFDYAFPKRKCKSHE